MRRDMFQDMREPLWKNSRFVADFRAVDVVVERFPLGCDEHKELFDCVRLALLDLTYTGYIESPKNGYQVNLTLDQELVARLCECEFKCEAEPRIATDQEIAQAVGRNADILIQRSDSEVKIIVEVEKANREKILRDIVKMLLFLENGQAELAALICPRNYAHGTGVWPVFRTAQQVLRAFLRVTELPERKQRQIALIGCTQEIFLQGQWREWNEISRAQLQTSASPYFSTTM